MERSFNVTLPCVLCLHLSRSSACPLLSVCGRTLFLPVEQPSMLRSVLLLKGDMTLSRFLEEKEANKHKADGSGNGGDDWWDDGVAEAVV